MRRIILVLIAIYLLAYLLFRMLNSEVWNRDGRVYVIYPEQPIAIYYLFRPLAYLDSAITGIGTHIGPHVE